MFKLSASSLSLFVILFSSPVINAQDTQLEFGNVGKTNAELSNVNHSGKLLLKKIKVNEATNVNGYLEVLDSKLVQTTTVNGHLEAKNSQFNDITVNGDVNLNNVNVMGESHINGKLLALHTKFEKPVTIFGGVLAKDSVFNKNLVMSNTKSFFENCTLNDVTIETKEGEQGEQVVDLQGTKVANITFKSGKGVVKIDDKSSISGKLTGGTKQESKATPATTAPAADVNQNTGVKQ